MPISIEKKKKWPSKLRNGEVRGGNTGMVGPVLLSDIFPDSEIDARSYFFEMLSAYKKELAMCGIEVDSRRRYIHNTKVQ